MTVAAPSLTLTQKSFGLSAWILLVLTNAEPGQKILLRLCLSRDEPDTSGFSFCFLFFYNCTNKKQESKTFQDHYLKLMTGWRYWKEYIEKNVKKKKNTTDATTFSYDLTFSEKKKKNLDVNSTHKFWTRLHLWFISQQLLHCVFKAKSCWMGVRGEVRWLEGLW